MTPEKLHSHLPRLSKVLEALAGLSGPESATILRMAATALGEPAYPSLFGAPMAEIEQPPMTPPTWVDEVLKSTPDPIVTFPAQHPTKPAIKVIGAERVPCGGCMSSMPCPIHRGISLVAPMMITELPRPNHIAQGLTGQSPLFTGQSLRELDAHMVRLDRIRTAIDNGDVETLRELLADDPQTLAIVLETMPISRAAAQSVVGVEEAIE